MSISIGQWREEIGNFNSYKYNTSSIGERSNFLDSLSFYKLMCFTCLYFMNGFLNNFDCYSTNLKFFLIILLTISNFTIPIFTTLIPMIIVVYKSFKTKLVRTSYFLQCFLILNYFIELSLNLILQHGDIETNPGPRGKHSQYFSFCHWNLNSLPAHNYAKVSLLQAFNTLHNFDLICLSETFLDSSISSEEESLVIDNYELLRADHPNDTKRGGVCIYHKKSVTVDVLELSQLSECLVCEVSVQNKKGFFVTLYRSPNQNHDGFQNFLYEFEKLLSILAQKRSDFTVIVGDFNARSTTWWSGDITNIEGTNIEALTSYHGFEQVINEPTHILPNSASCIDLIFADKPNLIVESGVLPSLHVKCHHQIIFSKLNLNVFYPPPYQRLVWDYKKVNIDCIRKALNSVDWVFDLSNKNVHQQAEYLNRILMNVFSNYIPSKVITINDKDPPWMNDEIRNKIKRRDMFYQQLKKYKLNLTDFDVMNELTLELSSTISQRKDEYYLQLAKKLNDPQTNAKTYWSILKTFFNGRKIPVIPPILVNGNLISDFKEKANRFNEFFSRQCTPLNNGSECPGQLVFVTNERLSTVVFDDQDIIKIIRALNINKSHGHDDISIRMIKICDSALVKPLSIIFNNCLRTGTFPYLWKKSNVIPVHKKNSKQLINNYRPVSLLPIFGKMFERIIFDNIYKYLDEHDLLNPNQSGFRPNDSCIYQLMEITHNIFSSFDCNPTLETRAVFLDISKAFDKVWHKGLMYKLESIGISGSLLNLMESFLNERYQRVLLNGQSSEWASIKAGVPQGSILGPLLFLIYINDLSAGLSSNVKLFADDTSIFSTVYDINNTTSSLNSDLKKVSEWAYKWKMSFNPDPAKQAQEVIFSRKLSKPCHPIIEFNSLPVQNASSQKHLGLILDEKLNFDSHLKEKCNKFNKGVGIIKKLQHTLPRQALLTIYKSFVRPHLDYGDIIYDQPNNESFNQKLESYQYNAALAITGAIRGTSQTKIYKELGLESLKFRRYFRRLCTFFKIQKSGLPSYLFNLIPHSNHNYVTRQIDKVETFYCRTDVFKNSFFPSVINEWNKLKPEIRTVNSFVKFRNLVLNLDNGRPFFNPIYNVFNPVGLKHLTRLRLGLSHLNEHKFKHNFQDCVNPLCACSLEPESNSHFFLRCHNYSILRADLMNDLKQIDENILRLSENSLVQLLLFGDNIKYSLIENSHIINASISFVLRSERFKGSII